MSSGGSRKRVWRMSKSRCAHASLKARLTPIVSVIVAVGTGLVLWFGARMALGAGTSLSPGSLIMFIMYLGKMLTSRWQDLEDDRLLV